MMKIDHTIKCVRKSGYHLGTILGTILRTMVAFFCVVKIEISSNFKIFVMFWVPNGTQSGTQNFFIVKFGVSAF